MSDAMDVDHLAALARAATPGPWTPGRTAIFHASDILAQVFGGTAQQQDANVRYVAALSPDAVLSLLQRLRAGEQDTARLDWFDARCEAVASSDGQTHIANAWGLYAQCSSLRGAIDEQMIPEPEATANADIF